MTSDTAPGEIDHDLLERALDQWGQQTQTSIAQEELGELQTELARWWNYRAEDEDVVDEIADVLVAAHQMAVCFGVDDVNERVEYKMERLEQRLDDAA